MLLAQLAILLGKTIAAFVNPLDLKSWNIPTLMAKLVGLILMAW
jgi:hypothetical protein